MPRSREIAQRQVIPTPKSGDAFQLRGIDRRRLFEISCRAAHLPVIDAQLLVFSAAPGGFGVAAENDPRYEVNDGTIKGVQ